MYVVKPVPYTTNVHSVVSTDRQFVEGKKENRLIALFQIDESHRGLCTETCKAELTWLCSAQAQGHAIQVDHCIRESMTVYVTCCTQGLRTQKLKQLFVNNNVVVVVVVVVNNVLKN